MPQIKLNARDTKKLVNGYTKKGKGLAALSEEMEISIPVVRRLLEEAGVKIRGRGRPVSA